MLHLVCAYSSYCVLVPIPDKDADTIASAFIRYWVAYFQWPSSMYSDNGGEFANDLSEALTILVGIQKITIIPRHPQANGFAEANVKKWKKWIRNMYMNETDLALAESRLAVLANWPRDWDGYSARGQAEINKKHNPRTDISSFNTVINRNNKMKLCIKNLVTHQQKKQKKQTNNSNCSSNSNSSSNSNNNSSSVNSNYNTNSNLEKETVTDRMIIDSLSKQGSLSPKTTNLLNILKKYIHEPCEEELLMNQQFHYSQDNAFEKGANSNNSKKMQYMYQQRLLQDKLISQNSWHFKKLKKDQADKHCISFPIRSKIQVLKNGKWCPQLSKFCMN